VKFCGRPAAARRRPGGGNTCPTGRLRPHLPPPRSSVPGVRRRLPGTVLRVSPASSGRRRSQPSPAAPGNPAPGPVGSRFPPGPAGTGNEKELTGGPSMLVPATSAAPRVTPGRSYRERAPAQPAAASVLQLVRRAGSFPSTPALARPGEGKEAGTRPSGVT
jgi:hypothetical protein